MSPDRDDETGQFEEEYPVAEFLQAVRTLDTATTNSVAESVGCSYDLAYRRLHTLAEEGQLDKERIGGTFVWYPLDE
ncbi:hth domain-containing protein [Haloarcula marismortui ATCC 33799]|uniref:Hth domain-containing protein n=1 Tax=Haloarcula marismortui ATCC 33799 TaxID=662475 RepID=M0K5J0_9EURY|nr:hth domain-containing protein [Haloarcula californiae ATCC 33799]